MATKTLHALDFVEHTGEEERMRDGEKEMERERKLYRH